MKRPGEPGELLAAPRQGADTSKHSGCKRKEYGPLSQRCGHLSNELRCGDIQVIAHEKRTIGRFRMGQADAESVSQIADVNEAPSIVYRSEGQWHSGVDRAHQLQEMRSHARAINKRRTHDYDLHSGFGCNSFQSLLGVRLGSPIRVHGCWRVAFYEAARPSLFSVDLDRTYEYQAPHAGPRRLARELFGPVRVDPHEVA